MRNLFAAAIGLAALAGACGLARAQDQQGPPPEGPPGHEFAQRFVQRFFERFDNDHNGVVTRAEFDAVRAAEFARLDANHDGQLSRDEMRAGHGEMFRARGGEPGPGGRGGFFEHMLERADANHDGSITRDEFLAGPIAMFNRLDKNHDGVISADELRQARAEMAQQRQGWRGDRGGDENAAPPDRPDGPGPMAGDGAISRAQWDAMGAAMFRRLDANGDGQVTQAEAEAARPHPGQ
jgi:Ca2+-binding EF-hand superfamily protein